MPIPLLETFALHFNKEHVEKEYIEPLTMAEQFRKRKFGTNAIENGHRMITAVREHLSKFDTNTISRSYDQVCVQEKMLATLGRYFYKEDYKDYELSILKFNDWEEVRQEIIMTSNRRSGKTWSVAMLVLCLLTLCEGIKICVFSSGARASEGLQEAAMELSSSFLNIPEKSWKGDHEHLIWTMPSEKQNIMKTLPGAVDK
jgi:hypothetical protein